MGHKTVNLRMIFLEFGEAPAQAGLLMAGMEVREAVVATAASEAVAAMVVGHTLVLKHMLRCTL